MDLKIIFLGISNTVGRVVVGFISDYKWVNSLIVTNISISLCGISVMVMPECSSYGAFVAIAILFGFFLSAIISLQSIVVVYLFGLDNLTDAFGFLKLFIGMASIVGPPFAGFLYDQTQSYKIPFYVAGGVLLFSSVFGFIALYLQKKKEKKQQYLNKEVPQNNEAIDL